MNGTIIDECHAEVRPEKVSSSCLDENVCIETCRKYFSHDGWTSVLNVIEAIRKNPVYYCGRCTTPIADDKHSSLARDSCLTWFHFQCLNLKVPPRQECGFVEDAITFNTLFYC